ncbi:hypothetical protein ABQJ54_18415 [Rhodanobacter sp. Si-c]|uniref:Uncharacterized protein n=1 Tax=Rhodanobacter lycopersici TaxID=3162487 RepID=A0ABV3QIR9_9GAMM
MTMKSSMIFLMVLLGESPMLLAALIGSVVTLVLWRRAPRSAMLVLIVCMVELATVFFGVWMQGWWFPAAARDAGRLTPHLAHLMSMWGVCRSMWHGAAVGLLIWAAFAGRPKA